MCGFLLFLFANKFARHIENLPQPRGWERKIAEGPPCVVLASPGFMQNGPSRELFELWAPDSRNGIIITGYSVEGTLARVSHHKLFNLMNYRPNCRLYVTESNVLFCIISRLKRESLPFCANVGCYMCTYDLFLLGHHDRTRRSHVHEGSTNTAQDIGRLYFI